MKPIDPVAVEHARKTLERVRAQWLERPGVADLDIGLRERDGNLIDEIAIRVHVARKRAPDSLEPDEALPREEDGVPIDVIEVAPRPTRP